MKKITLLIALSITSIIVAFLLLSYDPNKAAAELFSKGSIEVQSAVLQRQNSKEALTYYKRALKIVEKVIDTYPTTPISTGLLSGDIKLESLSFSELKILVANLEQLIVAEDSLSGYCGTSNELFNASVSNLYAHAGEYNKTIEFSEGIQFPQNKIGPLIVIAKHLLTQNNAEELNKLLLQIEAFPRENYLTNFKKDSLIKVAKLYIESKQPEKAKSTLLNAIEEIKRLDDYAERAISLSTITKLLIKIDENVLAEKFANLALSYSKLTTQAYSKEKIYKDVAYSYATGSIDLPIIKFVKTLKDLKEKVEILLIFSKALTKNNRVEDALNILQVAADITIKSRLNDSRLNDSELDYLYYSITKQYLVLEKEGVALDIIHNMPHFMKKTRTISTVHSIIEKYVTDGRFDDANKLADKMHAQQTLLFHMSYNHAISQQFKEAETIAESITNVKDKLIAFTKIAIEYAKDNKKEKALETLYSIMQQVDSSRNSNLKSSLYVWVSSAYIGMNEMELAHKITYGIKTEYRHDQIISEISEKYASLEQYDKALNEAKFIKDEGQRSYTLVKIIKKMNNLSSESANDLLSDAVTIAMDFKDRYNKSSLIKTVANTYAENQQLILGINTIKRLCDD